VTLFERFDQHQKRYVGLFVAAYLLINNSINATSDWMETTRDGSPDFAMWEPFLWEYSSAISTLCVLPILLIIWGKLATNFSKLPKQMAIHFVLALLFSICHVSLMVLIRWFVYALLDSHYDFGPVLREFFYEFRKDAWGYVFFFTLYHLYQFIYRRLKGEANLISAESQDHKSLSAPEHFLVKKLDREFLVKVVDIEWLESSGNYVNLHSAGRIYPLRATLGELAIRLADKGFSRIHRSYMVNHDAIEHISYQSSGNGEIKLKNGHTLSLSRRYKDEFKQRLS
jgi:hypothetical protein